MTSRQYLFALALFFSYVFIPILPAALLEFLSAPTPYIMGVHESYKDIAPDLVRKLKVAYMLLCQRYNSVVF